MQEHGTDLPTVCVLCSHNCGLRVDVEDGRIVAVRGDETNPITKGYVCNKAFAIAHYVEHGDRVRHPLRRRADGTFERIDWDTAIARDRGEAERDPQPPLAARHRAGRHRRAGQPHGRALRHGVPARRRLAALVQRLRAGEDAAQPPRPVDVRRVAGDLPARRHRARPLPAGARHQPQDLQPRPQRHRHVQEARRRPDAHRRRRRSARDRDDAHGDAPSARAARDRRLPAARAWRR